MTCSRTRKADLFEADVGIGKAAGENGSLRFKLLAQPSAEKALDCLWQWLIRDFPAPQAADRHCRPESRPVPAPVSARLGSVRADTRVR